MDAAAWSLLTSRNFKDVTALRKETSALCSVGNQWDYSWDLICNDIWLENIRVQKSKGLWLYFFWFPGRLCNLYFSAKTCSKAGGEHSLNIRMLIIADVLILEY